MMRESIQLPIIDLTSPDPISTARAIRQACVDVGFFYLINHGVDERLFKKVLEQNKKFFSLPLEDKMKLVRRNHRGYTPLYAEKLDTSSTSQGDSKESFYIGSLEGKSVVSNLNQWPAEEVLPSWRSTMEDYHRRVLDAGIRLISLIALALDLDEDFFHKAGACDSPNGFLRLLHYPGKLQLSEQVVYGASAHSDYGMLTLLATDGVGGLQVCREKFNRPQIWEDVHHLSGAFIVNIGDMMERWTNCLFRSTLHRVMPTGQERYSMAFFLDPNPDCVVECLKSCCSDSSPPRFPPIRAGEYLEERLKVTYVS
ncbi:2-oxoglutarate-Fe(II) type oxidoreductase hxnY isoform X2 [Solanum stenotomum]|uniref:2-oxoglutarate-Fe(II) type oxidoreductase hxnY isoform X2 n=1 Tax=Solanum stenotomum TaxID=172797 RepID=UPI0020D1443F|nr:2-oxoglutarate-Fe(II) type oxidoreductase hxnY isoform X2 [Solanum stenotomum]